MKELNKPLTSGKHTGLVLPWRKLVLGLCIFPVVGAAWYARPMLWPNQPLPGGGLFLPKGDRIHPAGDAIDLPGDMPVQIQPSADQTKLYVVTGGFHDHGLQIIDLNSKHVTTVGMPKASQGLVIAGNRAFISSADQGVSVIDLTTASKPTQFSEFPKGSWVTGMVQLPSGDLLVADINRNELVTLDSNGKRTKTLSLPGRPFALALSPNKKEVAVGLWGAGTVSFLDSSSGNVLRTVKVGTHPNSLSYAPDGTLFVTNGSTDSLSAIQNGKVVGTAFLQVSGKQLSATPTSCAITADGKTLFVADSDANNVAVLDVSKPQRMVIKGFVPTGWYPTTVACTPNGRTLYIGNGKGLKSRSNKGVHATAAPVVSDDGKFKYDYICDTLAGSISVVDLSTDAQLKNYTATVRENAGRPGLEHIDPAQKKEAEQAWKQIKHVVYVIRENRTYDQVMSDLPGANGDTSLLMYGEQITPNGHAIAKHWVTLDNLYCDGEVSEDGHHWCDGSYVTDFTQRKYPVSYSDRGDMKDDDFNMSVSPAGYLWDNCEKHGKSYLSYGEGGEFKSTPNSPPVYRGVESLKGHSSIEWGIHKGRDYEKINVFIDDLKKGEKTGKWPNFMVMSLGEDHTAGLSAGNFTPYAAVASNDLALGKMVEAISKSKFWKETAIFVIEDDAQDGADHVDSHRTVGLLISPYVRQQVIDSTMYCTGSMVATMEKILKLPPMVAHDRDATPMWNCFTSKPDLTPYIARPAQVDLQGRNPKGTVLAKLSEKLDLSSYDKSQPGLLFSILWQDAHPGKPVPKLVNRLK